jgi:hypothetical protein
MLHTQINLFYLQTLKKFKKPSALSVSDNKVLFCCCTLNLVNHRLNTTAGLPDKM